MSAPYPTPTSPLFEIACDWIRRGNNMDLSDPSSMLADSYTWCLHPSTLRGPDETRRLGIETFLDRLAGMWSGFVKTLAFDVDHPANVVEGKDCIVIQVSCTAVTQGTDRQFPHDCVFIFRFDEHQKIVSVDQWTDSAAMMKAFEGEVAPQYGPDGRVTNVEEAKKARQQKI